MQEALTNVAKHAQAEHVRVTVGSTTGGSRSRSPTTARASTRHGDSGFGLAGMRERVTLSGGRLAIAPAESGTTVRAVIPLPGARRDGGRRRRAQVGV